MCELKGLEAGQELAPWATHQDWYCCPFSYLNSLEALCDGGCVTHALWCFRVLLATAQPRERGARGWRSRGAALRCPSPPPTPPSPCGLSVPWDRSWSHPATTAQPPARLRAHVSAPEPLHAAESVEATSRLPELLWGLEVLELLPCCCLLA